MSGRAKRLTVIWLALCAVTLAQLSVGSPDPRTELAPNAAIATGAILIALVKVRFILREFMEDPTAMVSKEQAAVALAKLIAAKRPEEARKLVDPLTKEPRSAVQRAANSLLAELPPAPPAAKPPVPAKK